MFGLLSFELREFLREFSQYQKNSSNKGEVRIIESQIMGGKVKHELRVTSCEFKSRSFKLKSTSYDFKSTSYEFKSTSYEFKFTS